MSILEPPLQILPPLQVIPNNPSQYNLSSTNTHNTQHSIRSLEQNSHISTSNNYVQHHNVPIPSSYSIRTNPYFTATSQIPTNTNNLQTHTSHSNFHINILMLNHPQLFQIPHISTLPLLFQNQSNHLMVLIKKNTPEDYLQARVTFSLVLQPSTSHEYKIWHARRLAFIQCSLTGTALNWYIRLTDTYKQDWSAFVQAFKKPFLSQKIAYYAQVEALTLDKMDFETVRHVALKVQQLVENGWCNDLLNQDRPATINLKCNEITTKGLPKNISDFASKRQVKHTSTVLEPSIPFHTLVKLVDAEDIANDKIRTHDLTLEGNSITNNYNHKT